jgi:hypothetical protein
MHRQLNHKNLSQALRTEIKQEELAETKRIGSYENPGRR